jgi:hypothetical protein
MDEDFLLSGPKTLSPFFVQEGEDFLTEEQKRLGEKVWKESSLPFEEKIVFYRTTRKCHCFLPYRYVLTRRRYFEVFSEYIPVSVSGVVVAKDFLLLGKRSEKVSFHKRVWESPPSGSLSESSLEEGKVDVKRGFLQELQEETGIDPSNILVFSGWWCAHSKMGIEYIAKVLLKEKVDLRPCEEEYIEMKWAELVKWKEIQKEHTILPLTLALVDALIIR